MRRVRAGGRGRSRGGAPRVAVSKGLKRRESQKTGSSRQRRGTGRTAEVVALQRSHVKPLPHLPLLLQDPDLFNSLDALPNFSIFPLAQPRRYD